MSPHALTEEQIKTFHEEGYLVVEKLFDGEDLQPAIDDVSADVDQQAKQLFEEGVIPDTYAYADFEHRLALISEHTPQVALSMWDGRRHWPGFFKLLTNPKLLDLAESLCGEELIASSVYRLRPKIPNHNKGPVPWHQDSGYFEPYCDKSLVLTVWVPLVDATPEKGCLWVLPRGHRSGVVRHMQRPGKPYLEIDEADLPPGSERVCCPVPKGGVLLLTNLTPHVSFENTTDCVRWSMDLRYQSAEAPTNAKITRLDGESMPHGDRGDDDYIPPACYAPEADFLVRSKKRPHEICRSADDFAVLREKHVSGPAPARWNVPGEQKSWS